MKTSSKKAKGRRFQQEVCARISEAIKLPWGPDQPIESRGMGQNGVDIRLDQEALSLFKFSVETKNQETWSVPAWIQQAKSNQKEGTDWLLMCTKNRMKDPTAVVIMDIDTFFRLITKTKN